MTYRNGPTIALLTCLASATLLCACGQGSPEAGRPNTAPPQTTSIGPTASTSALHSAGSSSTSAPTTALPAAPPTRPPAAIGSSLAAGEAFIAHYVALLNYSYGTGDGAPLLAASDKGCIGCEAVADYVKKINVRNGTLAGDYNDRLIDVKEIFRAGSGRLGGSAILNSGSYTERKSPGGTPVPQGRTTGTMEFTLAPSGGNWIMYEMEIKE